MLCNARFNNYSCNNAYTFSNKISDNLRNETVSMMYRVSRKIIKIISYWVTHVSPQT